MDTLTHTLTGWTIGRLFPQRWGAWVAPTAMVAANLPDFEFFFVPPSDTEFYLLHHRGWSHSLLGIGLEAIGFTLLIVAVARLFRRRFVRDREMGRSGAGEKNTRDEPHPLISPSPHLPLSQSSHFVSSPFRQLSRVALLVFVCAYSHLFLDWWNTYGVRPFYPFDKTWYYGDMAFIMDPWIWMMLAGTLLLGTRFRKPPPERKVELKDEEEIDEPVGRFGLRGIWLTAVWTVALAYPSTLVVSASRAILGHWYVMAFWFLGIGLLVAARSRWGPQPPRRLALAGTACVAVYLVLLSWISDTCLEKGIEAFKEQDFGNVAAIDKASANPTPGVPWRYEVLVQTEDEIFRYSVNALTRGVEPHEVVPANLDDPALTLIEDSRAWQAWKSFARHPVVRREDGVLILGDARYQLREKGKGWSDLRVPLPAP